MLFYFGEKIESKTLGVGKIGITRQWLCIIYTGLQITTRHAFRNLLCKPFTMKRILWMLPLVLLSQLSARSQTYYDFYYTNLPVQRLSAYATAFRQGFDRVYIAGYSDTCQTCAPIAGNAPFKTTRLPALRQQLLTYIPADVYMRQQVPGSYYHIVGNKTLPYIIRTLYTINGDHVSPMYQVKITFTEDPVPSVYDIQLIAPKAAKRFSTKLVLTSYRRMVEPGTSQRK
jgi:hypothetical protein